MENIKQININDFRYYFFNGIINIKKFWFKLIKNRQKITQKHRYLLYRIHHNKKSYENIYSVNPLFLIIGRVNGFIEEKNESKYLVFDSTDENKEVIKKYTELWDRIKNQIKTINDGKVGEYGKDFIKIKFNSDEHLPLNRLLKLRMLTIVVRSTFEEDGKFYPQIYLD